MSIFTSSENLPETFSAKGVQLAVAWVWRGARPQDIQVERCVYYGGERRIVLREGSIDDIRAIYAVARESSPYTDEDLKRHLVAELLAQIIAGSAAQ